MKGSVQKFECIEYNYYFAECKRAAEIRKLLYIVVVDVLFFVEKNSNGLVCSYDESIQNGLTGRRQKNEPVCDCRTR